MSHNLSNPAICGECGKTVRASEAISDLHEPSCSLHSGNLVDFAELDLGNLTENQVLACIIRPSGTVEVASISGNLESIQKIVGGYIEALTLRSNLVLYFNEDGRGGDNLVATRVARAYGYSLAQSDVISGTAVLIGVSEDGEEADVNSDAIRLVEAVAGVTRAIR